MKNRGVHIFFIMLMLSGFVFFSSAQACTIWAATGERVRGKGSIVAKNRDNLSYLYTELRTVFPDKGFPFVGIFDIEANGYVTAGINEKGLVVVNASANSVPAKKRHVATEDLTERLLTSFASVSSILSAKDIFRKSHPAIYIIGDASNIASVEVAPRGRTSITIKKKGVLAFTNHFTGPKLLKANERLSRSSFLRLKHINQLMAGQASPFTMNDFIHFSGDQDGEPDGALWRAGTLSGKIRTLASWIVSMPPNGPPEVYVRLANPDEPEIIHRVKADRLFWEQRKNRTVQNDKPVNAEKRTGIDKPEGDTKEPVEGSSK